jgi:TetR/AcrR family transcriptional regulator, tetracycline repressor protein
MPPTEPGSAGRQQRLTRDAILDRALAVADGEGLDAVSVRRLARELGVTPMALYWHFDGKGALLHALGDRLLGGLDLTVDERAPWPEQLRALVVSLTAVLRAHPSAAALIGSLPTTASEHALQATEVTLDILRRAGFSPEEATHITHQIVRTTTSMVIAELDVSPVPGEPGSDPAGKEAFLRSLSPARFPRVIEAAGPLSAADDPEKFYDLVIELILAGIEAAAARRSGALAAAEITSRG